MGTRKVAADDGLPNGIDAGGTPESSVAVPLKTPHLGAGISQASLSTNGRQAESVENDHELDGYTTSATDDTQRAAAQRHQHIAHGPTSLEEIIQDSPFLDLSSPMTAYEWLKAVVMLPWVAIKLFLSVTGLIMVWAVTRVSLDGYHTTQLRMVSGDFRSHIPGANPSVPLQVCSQAMMSHMHCALAVDSGS